MRTREHVYMCENSYIKAEWFFFLFQHKKTVHILCMVWFDIWWKNSDFMCENWPFPFSKRFLIQNAGHDDY